MKSKLFALLAMLAIIHAGYSDDPVKNGTGPLTQQYQNLLATAEVIEGYRMVKVYEVDRVWKAVTDSLKEIKAAVSDVKSSNTSLQVTIKALEDKLAKSETAHTDLIFAGSHIRVFGRDFKKSSFITLVLISITALIACIASLLIMGKVNYKACRDARKLYEDLYAEFDQYRHSAVERQIKLSRELQDYRNRQMDLRSA
ncbi:MAG: hypothetical protein HRU69_09445 [Flammeovirgaceae bacterium]|nr:MAG: hypothetical protein HRU69_09445 [Flammeovirgaceae bacterium]